jgi:hypothetical protein
VVTLAQQCSKAVTVHNPTTTSLLLAKTPCKFREKNAFWSLLMSYMAGVCRNAISIHTLVLVGGGTATCNNCGSLHVHMPRYSWYLDPTSPSWCKCSKNVQLHINMNLEVKLQACLRAFIGQEIFCTWMEIIQRSDLLIWLKNQNETLLKHYITICAEGILNQEIIS